MTDEKRSPIPARTPSCAEDPDPSGRDDADGKPEFVERSGFSADQVAEELIAITEAAARHVEFLENDVEPPGIECANDECAKAGILCDCCEQANGAIVRLVTYRKFHTEALKLAGRMMRLGVAMAAEIERLWEQHAVGCEFVDGVGDVECTQGCTERLRETVKRLNRRTQKAEARAGELAARLDGKKPPPWHLRDSVAQLAADHYRSKLNSIELFLEKLQEKLQIHSPQATMARSFAIAALLETRAGLGPPAERPENRLQKHIDNLARCCVSQERKLSNEYRRGARDGWCRAIAYVDFGAGVSIDQQAEIDRRWPLRKYEDAEGPPLHEQILEAVREIEGGTLLLKGSDETDAGCVALSHIGRGAGDLRKLAADLSGEGDGE